MIDVIIPAYNARETIDRTLYSIAYQRNSSNLNVYIINDASEFDYKSQVDFFSNFINIKELKLNKNSGPGAARQYGIDHSNSEYIVFIDSDDTFATPFSLLNLYKKIENEKSDIVISNFLAEEDNLFSNFENDLVALHGKIYRRQFILEHNISFSDAKTEEDAAFNQLFLLYNPKISFLKEKTYIWMDNLNSITKSKTYQQDSLYNYTKAMLYALENGLKGGASKSKLAHLSYEALLTVYYYFDCSLDNNELFSLAKSINKIYKENMFEISDDEKFEILDFKLKCAANEGHINNVLNHIVTFDNFLLEIEGIV